jgi:hypothetical protein
MSIIFAFAFVIICDRYYNDARKIINDLNFKILEQEDETIRINRICERLALIKLNDVNININISNNYLFLVLFIQLIILSLFTIIFALIINKISGYYILDNLLKLFIILIPIILIISIILIFTDWLFFRRYINKIMKKINEIDDKIKNKREQINLISVIV